MRKNPLVGLAVVIAILGIGAIFVNAQEKKHDRADALAAKLGLNDQQKEEIRKVYADFQTKLDPIEDQLWMAHHEARAEFEKVLNGDQRAKAPDVMREAKEKELRSIADKIGLTDQQRQRVQKTLMQYEGKFKDLAARDPADARKEFRELKHGLFAAVGQELTDEERIRLQGVMREEFNHWREPTFRQEHVKALEDKLAMNAEQRTQADKIIAQCEQKSEKPLAQLKELCQQERAAVDKVLNEEQRTKLNQIMKSRGRNE